MSSKVPDILNQKRGLEGKWFEAQGWRSNPFVGDDKRLVDQRVFANHVPELKEVVTRIDDVISCFIVGSYGTGKTAFCGYVLEGLPKQEFRTSFVEKPSGSAKSFFAKILMDFRIEHKTDDTVGGLFSNLVRGIRDLRQDGKKCVIAVDEVADAPVEILQWLRVLCDENISVIFTGYPDTQSILRDRFFPLYDRIFKTIELKSLTRDGVVEFVARRVRVASQTADWERPFNQDMAPFEPEAIDVLMDVSGGAPRYLLKACYDGIRWAIDNDKHSIDALSMRDISRTKIESVFAPLSRRQRDIAELLTKRESMSSSDIAQALAMSTAAIDGFLKPMEEAEIIRKVGKRKAYEYSLSPMAARYLAREERS